jgi:Cof subfamily protein (haloacid dehalogenase superfamily)
VGEIGFVALDLDGTLLRSDLTVSDRSRAAITAARSAGITVAAVTARSPRSVRQIARDAGLAGIAICANGATLFDLDTQRIERHRPLSRAVAQRLVAGMRELVPGVVFGWEYELRFGSEPAYEALRDDSWWPRPDDSYPPIDPLAWDRPMTKLLARLPGADLDEVLVTARGLAGGDAEVTLTGTAFVEFMAVGVSKEAALVELTAARGVTPDAVAAFGDHVTDVGMLRWAGLGVAPVNAHPDALEAADEVTASNDDDGVAVVLERLVSRAEGRRSGRTRP